MTDILPWLAAHWLLLCIVLAGLIFLVIGVSWATAWYFWKFVIEIERDTNIVPLAYGDSPHLPNNYWEAVAREEARRDAT